MRHVTVFRQGLPVSAHELDFEPVKESWNESRLEDGTRLRCRILVTRVTRLDKYGADGQPISHDVYDIVDAFDVPPHLVHPPADGASPPRAGEPHP